MSSRVNEVNGENLQDPPPIKNAGYANGTTRSPDDEARSADRAGTSATDVSNNNNNSHDNVCGAVIMTEVIARVHPVHLMNVD